MKTNILIVLILNLALLFFSFFIFLTKGIDSGIMNWRFYASLFAMIGFLGLSLMVFKQLKNS